MDIFIPVGGVPRRAKNIREWLTMATPPPIRRPNLAESRRIVAESLAFWDFTYKNDEIPTFWGFFAYPKTIKTMIFAEISAFVRNCHQHNPIKNYFFGFLKIDMAMWDANSSINTYLEVLVTPIPLVYQNF